jgi:hypothetical protein
VAPNAQAATNAKVLRNEDREILIGDNFLLRIVS